MNQSHDGSFGDHLCAAVTVQRNSGLAAERNWEDPHASGGSVASCVVGCRSLEQYRLSPVARAVATRPDTGNNGCAAARRPPELTAKSRRGGVNLFRRPLDAYKYSRRWLGGLVWTADSHGPGRGQASLVMGWIYTRKVTSSNLSGGNAGRLAVVVSDASIARANVTSGARTISLFTFYTPLTPLCHNLRPYSISLFMATLCNRAGHYIFALWLLLSSIFFFSSTNLSRRRLDVYHTSTHGVP